jgi:hypothetical protein
LILPVIPDSPPVFFVQSGSFSECHPAVFEQESVVGGAVDPLPILQRHPEDGLDPVPCHAKYMGVLERFRILVHLSEEHRSDAIPTEVGVPLMPSRAISGRLESRPDCFDGQRVQFSPAPTTSARQVEVDLSPFRETRGSMTDPLAGDVDGKADQELVLHHLERCRMPVSHQVADQPTIVPDGFGPLAVRDSRGLNDRRVVPHVVNEHHESVGKYGLFDSDQPVRFRHSGASHRAILGHGLGGVRGDHKTRRSRLPDAQSV